MQIEQGQAVAILGPSGCGKSTLINTLAGTIRAESGVIDFVKDADRQPLSPKTHKIGMIPQNCGLLPWKTVEENCMLPLKIRRERLTEKRKMENLQICASLDIIKVLKRYPRELSGGQIQRAAIARAFILQPDLLLMDEPFSALDAITGDEARHLFLQVWEQNQPTTILVTHSIDEALFLGNTIIVMSQHAGKIIYQMENPYFGKLHSLNVGYLTAKQTLRDHLNPRFKRGNPFE